MSLLLGVSVKRGSTVISFTFVAFEKGIADKILETVYNPLGREFGQVTKTAVFKHYQLVQPITSSQR